MLCSPLSSPSRPYRINASPCVSGRNFAIQVSPPGSAVMGNSEPARNHDAADGPGEQRLRRDVEAADPGRAARRRGRPRQHPDGGRLAGTVWTEQPEHLSRGHVEVDAIYGLDGTGEDLPKLSHVDHACLLVTLVRSRSSLLMADANERM